jgi:hypothetical protein
MPQTDTDGLLYITITTSKKKLESNLETNLSNLT